jgi:hypothetical protein
MTGLNFKLEYVVVDGPKDENDEDERGVNAPVELPS